MERKENNYHTVMRVDKVSDLKNAVTIFILRKPDGTIILFFLFTDRQGNTPTLRHNLQMKHVFSESARSET
jgi:hypothetical protein